MNQIHSCIAIDIENEDFLYNMAFDGYYYYGTIRNKNNVVQLNYCFELIRIINTARSYENLTYDNKEGVFWATEKKERNTLYKLDCDMNEIECVIFGNDEKAGNIVGIAYNEAIDSIVVAYNKVVVTVDKVKKDSTVIYSRKSASITGVSFISFKIFISIIKDHKRYIHILSHEGESIHSIYVDTDMVIRSMFHHACEELQKPVIFDLFTVKKNKSGICQWSISEELLGFSFDQTSNGICLDNGNESHKPWECCNPSENYDPCECIKNRDSCAELIESIALVERSIAGILEVESEKLRKVVEETTDLKLILLVNHEVNKTIINMTHLEHTLYEKLSILFDSGICKRCHCEKADDNICECDVDGGEL